MRLVATIDPITAAALEAASLFDRIDQIKGLGKSGAAAVKKELVTQVHHVSENLKITKSSVVKAFKEPKMSHALEACGYSFATMYGAFHLAHKVAQQGALHVIAHFAEHTALHKVAHKTAHKTKVIDDFLTKHPVLKKVTGPALAGMMLYGYTLTEPHKLGDWNMENIKKAFTGELEIKDFLQTPEALYLGTHVATGKVISLSALAESATTLAVGLTCTAIVHSSNPKLQKIGESIKASIAKFTCKKSPLEDLAAEKDFSGQKVMSDIKEHSEKTKDSQGMLPGKGKPAGEKKAEESPKDEKKAPDPDPSGDKEGKKQDGPPPKKAEPEGKKEPAKDDPKTKERDEKRGESTWWKSMTKEQQETYVKEHPNSIYAAKQYVC